MDSKKDRRFLYIDLRKRTQTLSPIGFREENIYQASTEKNINRTKYVSAEFIRFAIENKLCSSADDLMRILDAE
jgi:hypothetical protein